MKEFLEKKNVKTQSNVVSNVANNYLIAVFSLLGNFYLKILTLEQALFCPRNFSFIQCKNCILKRQPFLNDQFHEILKNDLFVQRYKQKCAKI